MTIPMFGSFDAAVVPFNEPEPGQGAEVVQPDTFKLNRDKKFPKALPDDASPVPTEIIGLVISENGGRM